MVFSAFALQNLFVPDTGNEDSAEATEETTRAPETTEETTHLEETTALQGEGDLRRPPDSTLSYGRQEVRGRLGSYCTSTTCFDVALMPVTPKQQTLTVPSGSEMVFRYGGQSPPKTVNAAAYTFDPIFDKKLRSLGIRANADYSSRRSLKVYGSGVERTIPAELPPGEYGVDVLVNERQGDANYTFHVMVK